MDFAISIPQYVGDDGFDAAGFRAHLTRAEQLGFHSAWAQEQILGLGSAPTLDPLGAMTYAAACTERLRLGCAVFVTPLHIPVHLAKAIATVDNLSHGRVEVGVGTGGRARPFAAFGVDPSGLVARFNEGIELMNACWSEPEITFEGRFWKLEGTSMEPKPVQRPRPPLWIGGNHPDALRRAARLADGFFGAGSQSTAQFAQQTPVVREALAELGRDPSSFRFAKRVYIHVDDDAARARERLDAALARHYGRSGWSEVFVAGPPAECVAGLREIVDAGAELILLNTLVDDSAQMERLAAEVIPAL
ncbi:MAG: LLM class flavin-dependent oxidoreductase [Solirubrobacteraceae bacterium]